MKAKQPVTILVRNEGTGRYVARREGQPTESPLAVRADMTIAVRSARSEASLIAQQEGVRVTVEVEQANGSFKKEAVFQPGKRQRESYHDL